MGCFRRSRSLNTLTPVPKVPYLDFWVQKLKENRLVLLQVTYCHTLSKSQWEPSRVIWFSLPMIPLWLCSSLGCYARTTEIPPQVKRLKNTVCLQIHNFCIKSRRNQHFWGSRSSKNSVVHLAHIASSRRCETGALDFISWSSDMLDLHGCWVKKLQHVDTFKTTFGNDKPIVDLGMKLERNKLSPTFATS